LAVARMAVFGLGGRPSPARRRRAKPNMICLIDVSGEAQWQVRRTMRFGYRGRVRKLSPEVAAFLKDPMPKADIIGQRQTWPAP
jgi:uncharacterized protein with von Willebrand factor type A (vWA) domain